MADKEYMTPAGHRALATELERLTAERRVVVQGVADAAAEGDRSENAEYIYGKKRLREIDRKLRFVGKLLDNAIVVDPAQDRGERVYFGATVVLESEEGDERRYQLVGKHEASPENGQISYQSPIGKALMRKSVDDEVSVETPLGQRTFYIAEVRYIES